MIYKNIDTSDANFLSLIFSNDEYQLYFAENETTISEWIERIQDFYLDKLSYIIYNDDNKPVGWIMYNLVNNICYMDIIVFLHSEKFKGYGKTVFNDLINRHKDINKICLDVQVRNSNAIKFYTQLGFVKLCEEVQPIGDSEELYYKMALDIHR